MTLTSLETDGDRPGYGLGAVLTRVTLTSASDVCPDTDGCTPQLRTPITTRSDRRRHMESVQWWVESKHTQLPLKARVVPSALTPGTLLLSPGQFVQRRIQPLHPVLSPPGGEGWRPSRTPGLADPWARCRTGYEILKLNVETVWPPVSITSSPPETEQTDVVNTAATSCSPWGKRSTQKGMLCNIYIDQLPLTDYCFLNLKSINVGEQYRGR